MSKEKFNEKFLLSLFEMAFKNKAISAIMVSYMKPEFLPNKEFQTLLMEIKKHMHNHQKPPSLRILFQRFDNPDYDDVYSLLVDIEDNDGDLTEDEIVEELETFIKNVEFIHEYSEIGKLFNKNKKDQALKRFVGLSERLSQFSIKSEIYDPVIGGFIDRNMQAKADRAADNSDESRKFYFGIDELDQLTNGVNTGQVLCFMAASGGGKTKAMRWAGVFNARLGANVLHIQLEGSKEEALSGYGATLSGVHCSTIEKGRINSDKLSDLEVAFDKIQGEIYVKTFEQFAKSPTTGDVRRMVADVEKSNQIKIDLIIVDYLELLNTADGKDWSPKEERFKRLKIIEELKDIAVEFDNNVLTATQANGVPTTDLNNPEFFLTRHNVSEAKNILQPLTMFLTINKTYEESMDNRLRIWLDKSRFTADKRSFEICTDYAGDRFCDRKATKELTQAIKE